MELKIHLQHIENTLVNTSSKMHNLQSACIRMSSTNIFGLHCEGKNTSLISF